MDLDGEIPQDTKQAWGVIAADFDNDGSLDIWAVNGGPSVQSSTPQRAYLWLSEGDANRWLKAELRGLESSREAVGARLVAPEWGGILLVDRPLALPPGTDAAAGRDGRDADEPARSDCRIERFGAWPRSFCQ